MLLGMRELIQNQISLKKKHFDGLNPQWGGGWVSSKIQCPHFFYFYIYGDLWGVGVLGEVGLNPSKCFFFTSLIENCGRQHCSDNLQYCQLNHCKVNIFQKMETGKNNPPT